MEVDPRRAKSIAQSVAGEVSEQNVPFMAGSIAYQAFVSLIPLLALVFLAVAVVGDQSLANEVTGYTQSFLPPSAQDLLSGYIQGEADSSTAGAGVIGAVTLIWGTLKIFRGLDTAFSEIYNSTAENSFVDQITDGLVVLATIAGAVLAAAIATTAFAALESVPFIGLLNPILLIVGLCVVFFPMYYLFPDVEGLSPRDVVPGVVVAAVGWALLQALFQVYLAYAGTGSASGQDVIGAILLLLTWLYLSGLVLLLGAVVNAVLLGRTADPANAEDGSTPESGGTAETGTGAGIGESAVEELHAEARALRRERAALDRKRTELEHERDRPEQSGAADVEALRRANRSLRGRLRWYEKPIWSRAVRRLFGQRP